MQLNERSHIVTCVDILGYKEVLRRDDQEEIRRIEIEFQYFVEANIQKRANFPDFRCVSYTDNFLFFYKLSQEAGKSADSDAAGNMTGNHAGISDEKIENVLLGHISSLALTQFDLVLHNHFVRGGMTIGGFEKGSTIVSGSGLLEAHDLEEKAVHPRIILNPAIVRDYISFSRPAPLVVDKEDQRIFIDFLSVQMKEWLDPEKGAGENGDMDLTYLKGFRSVLSGIRVNIEKALEAAADSRVREKYVWLQEYFDFFCYSNQALGLDGLAIKPMAEKERFLFMKSWEDFAACVPE